MTVLVLVWVSASTLAGGVEVLVDMAPQTIADASGLKALQRPGEVFFTDGFESDESVNNYFEICGKAAVASGAGVAHSGNGAVKFTAPARNGRSSGCGAVFWFGPDGHDRVHFRRYIRFAGDYDQGNLNHVGGGLTATSGTEKWDHMGTAGQRPRGDDFFNASFEPWCDWRRYSPPGFMFLYVYWPDMKRNRDGNWWGNNLGPERDRRVTLERGRWYCLEHMVKVNTPGDPDGELAAWIDGELYLHFKGIRWRSDERVRVKRASFGVYVHRAEKDNTVWYDDIALSTGYIGPKL